MHRMPVRRAKRDDSLGHIQLDELNVVVRAGLGGRVR
jgi:hypothetical protein